MKYGFIVTLFLISSPSILHARELTSLEKSFLRGVATVSAAAQATSATSSDLSLTPLDRPDLIALTKPTIVRMLTHYTGTTTVPVFTIDLEKLTWGMGSSTVDLPYDATYSGSGFIISSDGYILTNSHVVSSASLRMSLAPDLAKAALLNSLTKVTKAQEKKLSALHTEDEYVKLGVDGITYIFNHLPIIEPQSVTVLKPSERLPATTTSALSTRLDTLTSGVADKEIQNLIAKGVPASIVAKNEQFVDDERDVALVRVNEKNLPFLSLSGDTQVQSGSPVFVFGFPDSGDLTTLAGEVSFTSGTVNALKDSTQHTFNYIQTDAKASHGSSGGPMINSVGQAIGIITIQKTSDTSGDNFVFGIPISIAKSMLLAHSVSPEVEGYASHLRAGLNLQSAHHCKAANEEFALALGANSVFGKVSDYVQPYIDSCTALIASGRSIDSSWDEVRVWILNQDPMFWVFVGGGILLAIILVGVIVFLVRRMRKDEAEMHAMLNDRHETASDSEDIIINTRESLRDKVMPHPQKASEPRNPELITFITQSRAVGQNDSQIKEALLAAGWGATVVEQHLNH